MPRFHLPPPLPPHPTFPLPQAEAHHAANVLRLRTGDPLTILDGAGQQLDCTIATLSRRDVTVTVHQRHTHPRPPWSITLCPALLKGKAFDLLLQKATELGATHIVPIRTERTIPQPADADSPEKLDKWRATLIEAAKQCGTPWLPQLHPPATLATHLRNAPATQLNLVASLAPDALHPRLPIQHYLQTHGHLPQNVTLWIGPEGDFTPSELAQLQTAGVQPITLGPHILRAETAALAALAILNHELAAPPAASH